jgi:hypothetical protein
VLSIITQIASPIIKSSFRWEKNLSLSHKLITITILLSLLLLANTITQQQQQETAIAPKTTTTTTTTKKKMLS